eukprot:TRINITY_DN4066_c0_g1_i2.p1 TRINITY_DN4066_c0_g1~~TRINITY_DN4066_c0_g1_i2.p1  ORF type:complete len:515 (-),score=111.04 TRINITY_DN4066_c0_g1_i2:14-1537(-)
MQLAQRVFHRTVSLLPRRPSTVLHNAIPTYKLVPPSRSLVTSNRTFASPHNTIVRRSIHNIFKRSSWASFSQTTLSQHLHTSTTSNNLNPRVQSTPNTCKIQNYSNRANDHENVYNNGDEADGDDQITGDEGLHMHNRQQMQEKTTNEVITSIRLSIHRAEKRVDWAELRSRLEDLSAQTEDPTFWSDPSHAQVIVKEKGRLQDKVEEWDRLQAQYKELLDLIELARQEKDFELLQEVSQNLETLQIEAKDFEIKTVFDKPEDSSPCFLEVHAGAGGTESTDWAQILLRMYTRYADRQGFKVELLDESKGDAGIKSACIKIDGDYAFGWLKNESGVHRLVRVSPFDSQNRRHTSFASILVYPAVNDEIHIDINPKDLLVDTMRSSGAGGQHVNKTESAVRLTHIPSGIVVVCSNDRSQHRNRAMAMETLRSRLYALEQKKKAEQKAQTASTLGDNSWGNQIRSYVLHPYQLIKDLRSDFETGDVESILDGDIESLLASNLLSEANKK